MKSTLFSGVGSCALACLLLTQGSFNVQQPQPPNGKPAEGIPVQYARACVHLAEIELKRAEDLKGAVSQLRLGRLRANVNVAKEQLEIAQKLEHGATRPLQLSYARKMAEQAAKRYQSVKQASESPLVVEEMRLRAEVARLRLAMWREDEYAPSLIDQMQWQIDRLTEEIVELNQRLEKLEK